MSSTSVSNLLEEFLAGLTASDSSAPCHTLLPQLQPSVDDILATLSPTDAEVFRPVLAGVPLISRTPPFVMHHPPIPAEYSTVPVLATMKQCAQDANAFLARLARENPMMFYATFARLPCLVIYGEPNRRDDLCYAARAALRLAPDELDNQMRLALTASHSTAWTTFKPLIAYRHACAAALSPLVDFGAPPPEVLRDYAWTWRTCTHCAVHTGRGACGVFCMEAEWFGELWKGLVGILRARPDPDAVLVHGTKHFAQALQAAMGCPTCANVAQEHLRCFQGLLVVEAAKRIAEVSSTLRRGNCVDCG